MTEPHPLPTWTQLVALMLVGDGVERPIHGIARTRDDRGHEWVQRIWVDGRRLRRESADGQVTWIQDGDSVWIFDQRDDRPQVIDAGTRAYVSEDSVLLRSNLGVLEGEDRRDGALVRAPEPTTFLGRPAWVVELLLEYWKSGHVTWVVDAQTGLVLRETDAAGTVRAEWLELTIGEPAPDGSFTWDGPTRPPPPGPEEEVAKNEARAAELGLNELVFRVPVEDVTVHRDEKRHLEVSLNLEWAHATLIRRPLGKKARWSFGGHQHRWSDDEHDWLLVTPLPLSDEELADVRSRLTPRPR